MSALASFPTPGTALLIEPLIWLVLRSVAEIAFAGAAMIVESRWQSRATPAISVRCLRSINRKKLIVPVLAAMGPAHLPML